MFTLRTAAGLRSRRRAVNSVPKGWYAANAALGPSRREGVRPEGIWLDLLEPAERTRVLVVLDASSNIPASFSRSCHREPRSGVSETHVYAVAHRDGRIDRNPLARLRLLREPSGRVRYLSDDEETALLHALPTDEDRQRVLVLLNTGLRKSEFLASGGADSRAGVLTIPRSKNGETRATYPRTPP
jgi:integrase